MGEPMVSRWRATRRFARIGETSRALPGMEPLVREPSSASRRSASEQSSASKPGTTRSSPSASRRLSSMERIGAGPKAGAEVNPFWSKRVQEVRLREARPEGLPPVPESGDEEEHL